MSLLKDTLACLRERGLIDTSLIIYSALTDSMTDFKIGLRSRGSVKMKAENAKDYRPTRAKPFNSMMNSFEYNTDGNFVDFGCGKGRVLLLASAFSFQSLKGIEFDLDLSQMAKTNLSQFDNIQIIHQDAASYPVDSHDVFFYFYDPFTGNVLKNVIENILKSLKESPRKITVVYHHNFEGGLQSHLIESHLKEVNIFESLGNRFHIYQN